MDESVVAPQDAVAALCARLSITPSDRLTVALTHPSYANEYSSIADNQRFEFLGDAVLGLCVSELLMARFEYVDEGQLTVMRASLVNTQALAEVAREHYLADALRLGRGADAAGERRRTNVLADAVEALVAAVYLDDGLGAARALTERLLGERIKTLIANGGAQRDAKSRLQERMQGARLAPPSYQVVEVSGPPHMREFTVEVSIQRNAKSGAEPLTARGRGRSKKMAAQVAAAGLLAKLRPVPDA